MCVELMYAFLCLCIFFRFYFVLFVCFAFGVCLLTCTRVYQQHGSWSVCHVYIAVWVYVSRLQYSHIEFEYFVNDCRPKRILNIPLRMILFQKYSFQFTFLFCSLIYSLHTILSSTQFFSNFKSPYFNSIKFENRFGKTCSSWMRKRTVVIVVMVAATAATTAAAIDSTL